MKKLIIIFTLLIVYSCGRSVEADVESIKDLVEKADVKRTKDRVSRFITFGNIDSNKKVYENEEVKANKIEIEKIVEEQMEINDKLFEIIDYYFSSANSDETLSFIRLLNQNKIGDFTGEINDREDLEEILDDLMQESSDLYDAFSDLSEIKIN